MNGLQEKIINISGAEWYSGRYLLKEWLWGVKNKTMSNCLNIDSKTRKASLDIGKYNALQMMAFLAEAPFEVTEEKVNSLPSSVGDELFKAIREIAGELQPEEIENLSAI